MKFTQNSSLRVHPWGCKNFWLFREQILIIGILENIQNKESGYSLFHMFLEKYKANAWI